MDLRIEPRPIDAPLGELELGASIAMQYIQGASHSALDAATAFFKQLNEEGVRYGIFKSSRNMAVALAGAQDLDILVARDDYHRFCSIASACGAIRSLNHRSLASPGREDWFVPDFHRAKYLHLDVHICVRLGEKFNKRYPFYAYGDIQGWDMVSFGNCLIPVVSAEDEARITLSRIAFRTRRISTAPWQRLTGDWKHELNELLFAGTEAGEQTVSYQLAGSTLQCRVKKVGDTIWARRDDLHEVREAVKRRSAAAWYSTATDSLRNTYRACAYFASRFINRVRPGSTLDRRQPTTGGIIVAVVAPDGMGKTTQVKRMHELFGWKFDCVSLYLGTGDGKGWWIRRFIRRLYFRRRSLIKDGFLDVSEIPKKRNSLKSHIGANLLAFWGILVALERFTSVCKARRMADRGFIVICDRWPQAIKHGFMDGPTHQRDGSPKTWLRQWELSLYDRMARHLPDISIQLIGDYTVSEARKPGELTRAEFEKRTDLMSELRKAAPNTHVLDASAHIDEVSRSIFKLIWTHL